MAKDIWELKILFRDNHSHFKERCSHRKIFGNTVVEELIEALGPSVLFEVIRERKFIHEKDKEKSFQGLVDDFLKNSGSYLLHPGFPRKFVLRKFHESQKGQHSLETLKRAQIRFNTIQPLLDILDGIRVGKPQKTFRVASEINSRRNAHICFFEDVEGQPIGI